MKNDFSRQFVKKVMDVKSHLSDDTSEFLFDARFRYLVYRNVDSFRSELLDYAWINKAVFEVKELDDIVGNREVPGLVIFGCGAVGEYTYRVISCSKYKDFPIYFCDNSPDKWGGIYLGSPIISPTDLENMYRDYICVIGSSIYRNSIWEQLLIEDFPRENILYPALELINGVCGWQYFDYFSPVEDEIFADCGVYDGVTSGEFSRWTKGNYKKIYGFEANPNCIDKCRSFYEKDLHDAFLIEKCLWDEKKEITFSNWYARASKVADSGNLTVIADTLDNILDGACVSLVKMDIEGAELAALKGAKKTIEQFRPRMAISIYHKPLDFIEIPALILEYDDSYRFAIRQYSSLGDETVLYAF